jgi:hypothetical protein
MLAMKKGTGSAICGIFASVHPISLTVPGLYFIPASGMPSCR